jgi:hypothetical protein
MGGMINVNNILVGKLEGKIPFGRLMRRWEPLHEIRCDDVDFLRLAHDRIWWRALMNLGVP